MGTVPSEMNPWWTQIWSGQSAASTRMRPGSTRMVLVPPSAPSTVKEKEAPACSRSISWICSPARVIRATGWSVSPAGKTRAAVARAVITYPRIILADEPTGALDSRATDELLRLFSEINKSGQTIIMVTHSIKAASHAKRVLFIRDGEVYHQLYRGEYTEAQQYQRISDTLTMLTTGGERK